MNMDTVVDIFLVILMLSASALCVYVIITLKNVTKTLAAVQEDVHQLKQKVDPILLNVDVISDRVAKVTIEAEELVASIKHLADDIKNKIDELLHKGKKIKDNFESPVNEWYRKVTGLANGIGAFWSTLKK